MGFIQYELPRELHQKLKVAAAQNGVTLKQYIIALLWEAVKS